LKTEIIQIWWEIGFFQVFFMGVFIFSLKMQAMRLFAELGHNRQEKYGKKL